MRGALILVAALTVALVIGSVVVWREPARAGVAASDVDWGRSVFQAKGCAGCHALSGVSTAQMAPALDGLGDWAATRRPGMSAEQYVRESIQNPSASVVSSSTFSMPNLALRADELDAVTAFLLSQRRR